MEQSVIRELSTADLRDRLEDETKQLVKLRINHAVSDLENPTKLKTYRKTIARIKTELRKRELEELNKSDKK
jgi:large subunit ribosomal protein L29